MTHVFGATAFLVLTLALPPARATELAPLSFHQTIEGARVFPEVERIARDHSIGEYRGGELTLRRYVDVERDVWLGLDAAGSLFQILKFETRTIAFLLSGRRHLVDCFFAPGAPAVAIDDAGEVLTFDPARWLESPRRGIVRRHSAVFAATILPLGAAGLWAARAAGIPFEETIVPLAVFASGGGILHGLVGAMEYSEKNNLTDGLGAIGVRLEGYRRAESRFTGPEADLDYVLLSAGAPQSLRELLGRTSGPEFALFDRACAGNLDQGIPQWSPLRPDDGEIGPPAARLAPTPKAPERPRLLGRRE